ncbi:MAG TPA: Yip1 family protein [Candidatus Limiplasma sp.]|nr:Yip1 family protein [Candidatus Limiplasma sp.]HRX07716.1 Yip1 family protein [Candidatus Limiplasma sp.]
MKALFSRERWKTLFHTVGHPADGYYWIRHEDTGSVWIAVLLVVLFSLSFSLNRMYASFVVSDVNPRSVASLQELGGVVLLFFMLCVGNWSVTCLMDGEGRFKDIVIAVGYAMLPMIVTFNLATVFSQFVAENEEGFYTIILIIGIAYTAMMMLTGIMQVHNYTLGKTLITLFLTLIAVFIIIFLILLIVNFITQIITFFQSIYYELIFRT